MDGGGSGGMDVAMALELLELDASDAHPSEDEIRAAFKAQALIWHPDKNAERQEEATVRFQQLSEALELLLAVGQAPAAAAGGAGEGPTAASLGLRAMPGPELPADSLTGEDEISVVWRCGACPEPDPDPNRDDLLQAEPRQGELPLRAQAIAASAGQARPAM